MERRTSSGQYDSMALTVVGMKAVDPARHLFIGGGYGWFEYRIPWIQSPQANQLMEIPSLHEAELVAFPDRIEGGK